MAASLGLSVDYLANFVGRTFEPFVVGFSVFVIGMIATYTRFVPLIKAKYDYGVMIFLLTFCLVVISGYRVSDNIDLVFDRIVTIMVGVIICLFVSIFVFPIWAGDDLHKLVVQNFEGLAESLEECLQEYFYGVRKLSRMSSKICKGQPFDDKIYKGYRGVLISKQTEESLANFASWEPRRGRLGCLYPWKRLVEVGAILRHCAYAVSALHGCVLSEIQAPESLRKVFAMVCAKTGQEVARVLRGVASDLRDRRTTKPKHSLFHNVRQAVQDLQCALSTYPHFLLHNPNHNLSSLNPNQQPNGNSHLNTSANVNPNTDLYPLPNSSSNVHVDTDINCKFSAHLAIDSSARVSIDVDETVKNQSSPQVSMVSSAATGNPQGESKTCSSLEFAESLSMANLITLLIEIVARVECLLDAVAEFEEEAGFRYLKACHDEDGQEFVDIKVIAPPPRRENTFNHPATTHVE